MNLRYIAIITNDSIGDAEYQSGFRYHTRFICHYLSKAIRKLRFETDGTFKMIGITIGDSFSPRINIDVLEVSVPFDKLRYESIKGTSDCSYYLELFKQGFTIANNFKDIPFSTLNTLLIDFEKNNCKHSWLHLKKVFKQYNLKIKLLAQFTTNDYTLTAYFFDMKDKLICSGIIIRTLPDEVFFDKTIKDVIIQNETIVFLDFNNNDLITMNLNNIINGDLIFSFSDYPDPNNKIMIEVRKDIIKYLSYDGVVM